MSKEKMVEDVLPIWAAKYQRRGYTVRKTRTGRYSLYRVNSDSEVYLGRITEEDGLIPKGTGKTDCYLEYGLSHMIWQNFGEQTERSTFDGTADTAKLIVIGYIFGSVDIDYLRASFLTYTDAERLGKLGEKMKGGRRLPNGIRALEKHIRERIPDEADYNLVTKLLMLCVVEPGRNVDVEPDIPEHVRDVLAKHGLKYT